MQKQLKWFAFLLFVALSMTFLPGANCKGRIRCRISNDCTGNMICGPRGYCVSQCKTTRDCHQDQRCVEGKCQEL